MPRIDGTTAGLYQSVQISALQTETAKAGKKDRAAKSGKNLFAAILKKAGAVEGEDANVDTISAGLENLSSEEAVGLLLEDVRAAGSALKDRPFPDEIIRYKKSVRAFMQYVVEHSFDVEIAINRIKQRKSALVVVVDQKLEQLAAAILSGQSSQLTLLSRVEEINGLLVDMLK